MDFLSIGDTVIDTFIRLKDARVHCDINNENCTITMNWGDKIPFESSTRVLGVGNSANAAVSAARLGLNTGFISALGDDRDGEDCVAYFKAQGIDTASITLKEGETTTNNYVLWYDTERTILVRYANFHYALPDPMPAPRSVYLSGIGEANDGLYDPIADWLEAHPEIFFAFQPGTFEIKAGRERLQRLYARANLCICNKEESQRILGSASDDIKELLAGMHAIGPKTAIITDATNGAYASDGARALFVPAHPEGLHPFERTGAGDAFASTVTSALTLGKPLEEALLWGPVNSASVVQKIGAQEGLLTREALLAKLASAPDTYKVSII